MKVERKNLKKSWLKPEIQSELSIQKTLLKTQLGPDGVACVAAETQGSGCV